MRLGYDVRVRASPSARNAVRPAIPAVLLLVGLLPAVSGVSAQAPQSPTFPTGTELVQVDAVVLDSRGEPVEGLREDDFVVKEDGITQSVRQFEAIALPQSTPSRSVATSFVSTNAQPRAGHRTRSFVIVFDDAQLSKPDAAKARDAVARFLRTGLRDDDEVTLVSTASGSWWSARLGEGRDDLIALLDRLQGQRTVDTSSSYVSDFEAMRIYVNRDQRLGAEVTRRFAENGVIVDPGNANALQAANALQLGEGHPLVRAKAAEAYMNVRVRNQATLHALERIADALAQGKGRKSVLLVSDGFVHDPSLPEFRDVQRAMNRANGSVYFLDARGLTGSSEFASAEFGRALLEQDVSSTLSRVAMETEGAESLAVDTGGLSLRNPNDLEGEMERVARESRSYYLLGYASRNTGRDGKFRKIEVAVRRPDVKVRARSGYYAPSDAPPEPLKPGELDPRIREALDSPFMVDGIPLRMAAYVFGPAASGRDSVLLVAEADPDGIAPGAPDGPLDATLDSYLVVTARDGGLRVPVEKQISLSLPASARARVRQTWLPIFRDLELPPGTYQARLLLRDPKTGRVGTVRHEFKVPPAESFRTSTPILTDSLQGSPEQARPVPLARRFFPSGANLVYTFEVYGAGPGPSSPRVTSACEVRRADGSLLVKGSASPIEPDPQGRLGRQVPISLLGAPAGDYEIVLTVEDEASRHRLQVHDPFTVSAPSPSPSSRLP
jgi:VWFA-related protein